MDNENQVRGGGFFKSDVITRWRSLVFFFCSSGLVFAGGFVHQDKRELNRHS